MARARQVRRGLRHARDPDARGLVAYDLFRQWQAGDVGAGAVLADVLAEQGYDLVAERILKATKWGRRGFPVGTAWEDLRFDLSNVLLQVVRRNEHDRAVEADMLKGIEDAVWLPQWMSAMEEAGRGRELPRNVTRRSADEIPKSGRTLARMFALALTDKNKATLYELYLRAIDAEALRRGVNPQAQRRGGVVDPETLGWYLAMQAQGHGVGWTDDHEEFEVSLPSAEWYTTRIGNRWHVEGYP